MSWKDTVNLGDLIDHTNWNEQADEILRISGSYANHSGQTNKHVDHSTISITAGDGLAGGGDLTTTRTINVGAGTGIIANSNDIEVAGYIKISSNAKSGALADNFWTKTGNDIYYNSGKVYIGSDTSYGNYNFQVSGDVFISGNLTFKDGTISGLKAPTYNSGAANKKYVDDQVATISDMSSQVALSSGLTADDTIWHDGTTTNMFLNNVPQNVLKSGSQYWKAYKSGQIALYSETYSNESDLTTDLDDDYAPSSLTKSRYDEYIGHSGNTSIHFTKNSINLSDIVLDRWASATASGALKSVDWNSFNNKQDALDGSEYYPSSLGKSLNDNYIGHSGNTDVHVSPTEQSNWNAAYSHSSNTAIHHTLGTGDNQAASGSHTHSNYLESTDLTGDITGTSPITVTGGDNTIKAGSTVTVTFDDSGFVASSTAISRFADSSNYSTHKNDNTIHFTKSSLDDDYAPSSLTKTRYDEYVGHSGNSDIHYTQDTIAISANQVTVEKLIGSTYDDIQDWLRLTQSAGKISGGTFTDNGDGTLTVSAGSGFIKIANNDFAETKFFDWQASSNMALTDNNTNYIYVTYDGGSPHVTKSLSIPSDKNTNVMLGLAYRDGTDIHLVTAGQYINNYAKNTLWKDIEINGKFQRANGLIISETGTRNIAITSGVVYAGLTKKSIPSFDSSDGDTFTYYYRNGAGGWTKVTSQSQIDNTYYDDGTGTLHELSDTIGWKTYYGAHWVYMDADGHVFVVYGQDDYLIEDAQNAQPPSTLPDLLGDIGRLIGKIIVQKGASTFESIQSTFDNYFVPQLVQNHNTLAGLQGGTADEYYHLSSAAYTEVSAFLDGGTNSHTDIDSHINNSTIHFTKASLDGDYYPSSLGNSLNTSYTNHSGQTNKHIDHSSVSIIAGDGLTGGGDITNNRTINIGAGTGINTNADSIDVLGYTTISSNAKKAYASAQIALYSETYSNESDLIADLDDNYAPSGDISWANISELNDTNIVSEFSGQVLSWDGTGWSNKMPSMTFNIANIRLSSQQNINITRFTCPTNKKVYVWQAAACNSGGTSVADLSIQILSGSTSIYKTSSSVLQEGNPLAVGDGGDIEIRLMYSGVNATGIQYGTGFMNITID